MAYTQKDFMEDLALYSAGAIIGVTRSRKFIQFAAKKGIQLAAFGATKVSPPVARGALGVGRATLGAGAAFARRNPGVAVGTGLYALNELGYLEEVKDTLGDLNRAGMENLQQEFIQPAKRKVRRSKSKFNKMVSSGMKSIRASTSYGKKGTINNAKKAFSLVTKSASAVTKGRKLPKSGIKRKIMTVMRKLL
jgi:hypothetical protein